MSLPSMNMATLINFKEIHKEMTLYYLVSGLYPATRRQTSLRYFALIDLIIWWKLVSMLTFLYWYHSFDKDLHTISDVVWTSKISTNQFSSYMFFEIDMDVLNHQSALFCKSLILHIQQLCQWPLKWNPSHGSLAMNVHDQLHTL